LVIPAPPVTQLGGAQTPFAAHDWPEVHAVQLAPPVPHCPADCDA
jgi:hypothetical protein